MTRRPKLTLKNFNYGLVVAIILCLLFWLSLMSGCSVIDYGDLHYRRFMNFQAAAIVFSEYVEDANGFSDVTIIILSPEANHDDMAGKLAEGIVRGLVK